MTKQSEKTLNQLKVKGLISRRVRMPNIKYIDALLTELGIYHSFRESQNICETRSKGKRYVNSRWDGKEGYKLVVDRVELDTSSSYYSVNAPFYAREIVELIEQRSIKRELK